MKPANSGGFFRGARIRAAFWGARDFGRVGAGGLGDCRAVPRHGALGASRLRRRRFVERRARVSRVSLVAPAPLLEMCESREKGAWPRRRCLEGGAAFWVEAERIVCVCV